MKNAKRTTDVVYLVWQPSHMGGPYDYFSRGTHYLHVRGLSKKVYEVLYT